MTCAKSTLVDTEPTGRGSQPRQFSWSAGSVRVEDPQLGSLQCGLPPTRPTHDSAHPVCPTGLLELSEHLRRDASDAAGTSEKAKGTVTHLKGQVSGMGDSAAADLEPPATGLACGVLWWRVPVKGCW